MLLKKLKIHYVILQSNRFILLDIHIYLIKIEIVQKQRQQKKKNIMLFRNMFSSILRKKYNKLMLLRKIRSLLYYTIK